MALPPGRLEDGLRVKGPTPRPPAERFWDLVNGPWCDPRIGGLDCWHWAGGVGFSRRKWVPRPGGVGRMRARYGRFRWTSLQLVGAHQAALLLTVGPGPATAVAAHSCGDTLCVNPLQIGRACVGK